MAMRILMLAGEQSGVFYAERIKSEIRSAAQCEVEFRGLQLARCRERRAHRDRHAQPTNDLFHF